jgi:hypothetical protein
MLLDRMQRALYRSLCIRENFVAENLGLSFSGTCLAGWITGRLQRLLWPVWLQLGGP